MALANLKSGKIHKGYRIVEKEILNEGVKKSDVEISINEISRNKNISRPKMIISIFESIIVPQNKLDIYSRWNLKIF